MTYSHFLHRFVATSAFSFTKEFLQKYKGKFAIRPFLLSFEAGWSN